MFSWVDVVATTRNMCRLPLMDATLMWRTLERSFDDTIYGGMGLQLVEFDSNWN